MRVALLPLMAINSLEKALSQPSASIHPGCCLCSVQKAKGLWRMAPFISWSKTVDFFFHVKYLNVEICDLLWWDFSLCLQWSCACVHSVNSASYCPISVSVIFFFCALLVFFKTLSFQLLYFFPSTSNVLSFNFVC